MKKRVFALLAVFLPSAPAVAQYPEFQVNEYTTSYQHQAAVTATPDGLVAVWMSEDQVEDRDVYARRFSGWGEASVEFRVNSYTTGSQWAPSVAADGDGRFVVVWMSRQDGSGYGVFGQRFAASGAKLGGEFRVNTYTTLGQGVPDVAADALGGFVVVWDGAGSGDTRGIFARRYDLLGLPAGGEFRVNTWTTQIQAYPSVDVADGGDFVVAWQSALQPPDSSSYGVFARRFDAAGQAQGPEFLVNSTTTSWQGPPAVSMDAAGRFLVAWQGLDPAAPGGGCSLGGPSCAVFGRAYERSGTPMGPEFLLGSRGDGRFPDVALGAGGQLVAAWDDLRTADRRGVYVKQFEAFGTVASEEGFVKDYVTGDQVDAAVAMMPGGDYMALWSRWGPNLAVATDVFGRWDVADLIFRDGFEDHTLYAGSPWSAMATDDVNDLSVSPLAGLAGTPHGLQAVVDDTAALWVQDGSPWDEDRYGARFYFDTNGFDPGEALNHRRLRLFIAFDEDASRRLFTILLRRLGGAYALMGRVRLDDGREADTDFFPISDGVHSVELLWRRSSVMGSDGAFWLWIDGTMMASLSGLDNGDSGIGFARLGAISAKAGASGTLYLDEFESRRFDPIGP
jgi:hypothetical protein